MSARTFQDVIQTLNRYWAAQGCVLLQPLDTEVGAGTFHPATFLRALGPEPWSAAYVQPSRRPTDGRYGQNPNRLQHYYEYQVVMKPNPENILDLYIGSLKEFGLDPLVHDLRFVDNWESPTLGAWGLGWEVWLNGMEVTHHLFSGRDVIAADPLGQVLAVAERLDTLAGIFAIGMKPGGNKDPFALRRAALGLARTLIEGGLELDLRASFIEALEQLPDAALAAGLKPGKDGKPAVLQAGARRAILLEDLLDFVHERLRGYYAEQGFEHAAFESVLAVQPASLADFDRRLRAVVEFGRRPEAASLAAANKRVANILRKQAEEAGAPPVGRAVDPACFEEDAERELADALAAARQDSAAAEAAGDYAAVLARLAQLQAPVDAFFDSVLVNADDPAVRANRLALLNQLKSQFSTVADIALL
ncbi:hypothetical protein RLIN73S_05624 [Rhodanobacter lindaniclasticus]